MKIRTDFTEKQKGIAALVLLAVSYGIMPLIPRYLSVSFQLFQQIYLRMFFGFILAYILFHKNIDLNKIRTVPIKEWGLLAFRVITYYLFGVILYTQAVLMTKIGNVAFISAIPMTAILGFIILKEKFTLKKALLVVLSFLGVLFISIKDFASVFSLGMGELAALLSAFFVSLSLILRKWQSQAFNDREIATFMLFLAFLFIFIASLLKGEGLPVHNWHIGALLTLLLVGLMNSGISFLMNYGFKRVNAVLAGNIVTLESVFATFFAFLVFKEIPITKEFLGGALIITSAILMHRLEIK